MTNPSPPATRLAPSPTGALHLGNARTFLVNWLLARQNGWRIILRVEDIDGPRVKRGADQLAIDDLRWLGIDWDEGPVYQSRRVTLYDCAIRNLLDQGDAYYCVCTRREAQLAASAPHAEDGSAPYPGTCRGRFESIDEARAAMHGREPTVRFRVPDETVTFDDARAGRLRYDVEKQLGDFVIRKADGTPAYQLAVVVDDADHCVTEVVRGDDLLDSTPRQMLLYRALGMGDRTPRYTHLPLVVGPDGKRLAKRHGDTRLSAYRQAGVPAERVVGLLARWCGVGDVHGATARQLLERFSLQNVARVKITMTPADDAWLRAAAARAH